MKIKLAAVALLISAAMCCKSDGYQLLDRLLHRGGCGCASSCCDTPADVCCDAPAMDCCDTGGGCGLFSRLRGRSCGGCGLFSGLGGCGGFGGDACGCGDGCGCDGGYNNCGDGCGCDGGYNNCGDGCGCDGGYSDCGSGCGGCGGCGLSGGLLSGFFSRGCDGCGCGLFAGHGCRRANRQARRNCCCETVVVDDCGCDAGCSGGCGGGCGLLSRLRGRLSSMGCCGGLLGRGRRGGCCDMGDGCCDMGCGDSGGCVDGCGCDGGYSHCGTSAGCDGAVGGSAGCGSSQGLMTPTMANPPVTPVPSTEPRVPVDGGIQPEAVQPDTIQPEAGQGGQINQGTRSRFRNPIVDPNAFIPSGARFAERN